jgi:hypothetical protein
MSAINTTAPDRPNWLERVAETAPIVDAPAFFGPPISFVLGPWLLLLLLLIGPAALLITLVLVFVVAAAVLVAFVAVLASPYLLVRYLRGHHPSWRPSFAFVRRPAVAAPAVGDAAAHTARLA